MPAFNAISRPAFSFGGRLLLMILLSAVVPSVRAQDLPRQDLPHQDGRQALLGHGGPVRALAMLTDGRTLVSGSFDSTIIVWDSATGAARRVLRFHDSTVNALLALPGNCFASGGEDARIAIWCGEAAAPVRVLSGHTGPIAALAAAPDGQSIVSGAWDRTVRRWSLTEPDAPARVIAEHTGPVNGVAVLGDGRSIVSASYDGQVKVSTPAGPSRSMQIVAAINGLCLLPDGRIVLAGADGVLRILDQALQIVHEVVLPDGPLSALVAASDGRTLAVAGMRTPVTLIDLQLGKPASRILGPGLPVWSLAFAPDGAGLFSGGADRAIRRWATATGQPQGAALSAPADLPTTAATDPGAHVFRPCAACHAVTAGEHAMHAAKAGPSLHGVFGRRIATAPGYVYSEALRRMDVVWTAETIAKLFEVGPNTYTPGTKMPEQRLTDPAERQALVEWLARVTAP